MRHYSEIKKELFPLLHELLLIGEFEEGVQKQKAIVTIERIEGEALTIYNIHTDI